LPEQRESKGGEKKENDYIAEGGRDAEDVELRKRKVARTADTSGHWRIASAFGLSGGCGRREGMGGSKS
jgi:hypothetical protein